MLSVIGSWIYVFIFMYLSGNAYMRLQNKLIKNDNSIDIFEILFCGIMITTIYAQVYSIFGKLGLLANVILAAALVIYAICDRNYLIARIKIPNKKNKLYIWAFVVSIIATIVFAICSSGETKLIDTDWYHAQTIRWLEEYGCVKGVANLHYPLGFNSPQHYYDALFSQKFIFGQSMRFSGGLFGLLIFLHGIYRLAGWKEHDRHTADVLAIGEIVYSIIITAFYADPYTDTLPNILILYIVTEWFIVLESESKNIEKMALLCILGVFATAVKSSAAMVVLLTIQPAFYLIRDKRWKDIGICISEGLIILIPYAITNIITTGYPVMLLSKIRIPGCNWMIDPNILRFSVDNMIAFARLPGATMDEALNCGLSWVPKWFMADSISHKILYVILVLFIVTDIVVTVVKLIKKEKPTWDILPRISIYIGLVYWFMTIPQVKYCWAYLIIPVCVVPMCHNMNKYIVWSMRAIAMLVAVLYLGFYGLRTLGYVRDGHLLSQVDYPVYDFEKTTIDGKEFFIKKEDGDIACGYYVFPYMDNIDKIDELVVGDNIRDGFYYQESN